MTRNIVALDDFSGGLNLRDSQNQLALNETPDALNITLDERGAARRRYGSVYQFDGVANATATSPFSIFYSAAVDKWLMSNRDGNTGLAWKAGDGSGSWTTLTTGVVAGPNIAFADFPGNPPRVVFTSPHGSPATAYWDGVAANPTSVSGSIGGHSIFVWNNRVWVLGYPFNDANGTVATVWRSNIDDITSLPNSTVVRMIDGERLTGAGIVGGSPVIFKERSAYRITDSNTGAHVVIDSSQGAIGPQAIVPVGGALHVWGKEGLYLCDGIGPMTNIGDKCRPIFTLDRGILSNSAPVNVVSGSDLDKSYFAYADIANASLTNILEVSSTQGWIMKHQIATPQGTAQIAGFTNKGGRLYAALGGAAAQIEIHALWQGDAGVDKSTPFTARIRAPWISTNNGMFQTIRRAQVQGLAQGSGTTVTLKGYEDWSTLTSTDYGLQSLVNS